MCRAALPLSQSALARAFAPLGDPVQPVTRVTDATSEETALFTRRGVATARPVGRGRNRHLDRTMCMMVGRRGHRDRSADVHSGRASSFGVEARRITRLRIRLTKRAWNGTYRWPALITAG